MNGWWSRASTAQRLTQVDAGIELGLTGRQVAMASGAERTQALVDFANNHGRSFRSGAGRSSRQIRNHAAKLSAAAAYFRGEDVDFWRDSPQSRARHGGDVE